MSEGNGYATRDQLLGQPCKRRFTDANVLGKKFRLQSLNDREASSYDAEKLDRNGELSHKAIRTANARIIQLCVVDGEGNPVFSKQDIQAIQDMDSAFVTELANACLKHCQIEEEPEKN